MKDLENDGCHEGRFTLFSSEKRRFPALGAVLVGFTATVLALLFTLSILVMGRVETRRGKDQTLAAYLSGAAEDRCRALFDGYFYWSEMVSAVRNGDSDFLVEQLDMMRKDYRVTEILFQEKGQDIFRVGRTPRLSPGLVGRVSVEDGHLEVGKGFVLFDDFGKPQQDCVVSVWFDLSGTLRLLGLLSDLSRLSSVSSEGATPVFPGVWIQAPSSLSLLRELMKDPVFPLFLVIQSVLVFSLSVLGLNYSRERWGRRERLVSLAKILEEKDPYTMGHSTRVADYAVAIGRGMGLEGKRLKDLGMAAVSHDLGKIFVPIEIIDKPGQLNADEWAAIKQHPVDSQRLFMKLLPVPGMGSVIRHHHERWDGQGYPDGLAGDSIPMDSRIIAVADTFDALTSSRSYRAAVPVAPALEILRESAGTQLDPSVVSAALKVLTISGVRKERGKGKPPAAVRKVPLC